MRAELASVRYSTERHAVSVTTRGRGSDGMPFSQSLVQDAWGGSMSKYPECSTREELQFELPGWPSSIYIIPTGYCAALPLSVQSVKSLWHHVRRTRVWLSSHAFETTRPRISLATTGKHPNNTTVVYHLSNNSTTVSQSRQKLCLRSFSFHG